MKKQTVKLNESKLRNIIKESVKKVLNEMSLYSKHNGAQVGYLNNGDETEEYQWKYNPEDSVDKFMWKMKKEAEKVSGAIGQNGWPTLEFIENYVINNTEFLRGDRGFWDGIEQQLNLRKSDTNNVPPQKIYTFISAALSRNYNNKRSASARDGVFGNYEYFNGDVYDDEGYPREPIN